MEPVKTVAAVSGRLKGEAEDTLGPLDRAFVMVTATYGPYRKGLMKRAGYEKVELLPEPVAARSTTPRSTAPYRDHRNGDVILLYDLGGRSFEVTL